MINLVDIVGYAATIVGTSLMLPQVYKSLKTKSVDDVSWGMLVMYFLNCSLWLTYGALIASMPLAVTNAIALVISVVQIGLKICYSETATTRP